MTAPKRTRRSHRVAWPEPGHEGGGEFRLTVGRLIAMATFFFAAVGFLPIWWTVSDHFMNREEIKKAMKEHADHDNGVQAWNQYGFAANRVEYLDDKKSECELKKATATKAAPLSPAELAICARYEARFTAKSSEAADLKSKAVESTKEKTDK